MTASWSNPWESPKAAPCCTPYLPIISEWVGSEGEPQRFKLVKGGRGGSEKPVKVAEGQRPNFRRLCKS